MLGRWLIGVKAENQDEAMGVFMVLIFTRNVLRVMSCVRRRGCLLFLKRSVVLERQYGEILAANGIASDVFDSEDYAVWMANDISAAEITERVSGRSMNEQWDDSMKKAMAFVWDV